MGELNDRDEGGLFSDDYEIPKRENPYKKKKKTDSADDPASAYVPTEDKPAEKRENPYKHKTKERKPGKRGEIAAQGDGEAPPVDDSHTYRDQGGVHLLERKKPIRQRMSDFMFSHVKLICFIGGVIAVLLFISAPAIYYGIQDAREAAQNAEKEPLTMNYVKGLADKTSPITWEDLKKFPYDESTASESVTWRIDVKDTRCQVWISGVSTQKAPTYVYMYDMSTGDKVDLSDGLMALEDFLEERE